MLELLLVLALELVLELVLAGATASTWQVPLMFSDGVSNMILIRPAGWASVNQPVMEIRRSLSAYPPAFSNTHKDIFYQLDMVKHLV